MAIQLRMPKNSPSVHFSSDILKIFDANRGRAEKVRACPERRGVASNGWCTPRTIKTKTDRYQRHRTRFPLQSPRCTGGGGGFSYFPHHQRRPRDVTPPSTPFFGHPIQPSAFWTFGFRRSRSIWTRTCCQGSTSGYCEGLLSAAIFVVMVTRLERIEDSLVCLVAC